MIRHTIAFLSECPFCDSKTCHVVFAHPVSMEGVPVEHQRENFQVMCDNCGACGPIQTSEEDACVAWKTCRDGVDI